LKAEVLKAEALKTEVLKTGASKQNQGLLFAALKLKVWREN
jgi:hypothetical protein